MPLTPGIYTYMYWYACKYVRMEYLHPGICKCSNNVADMYAYR